MARLAYLDSTRGIAAIMVVFSHLVGAIRWDMFHLQSFIPYFKPFYFGEGAVSYFFVLSGFVLTIPFHKKQIDTLFCIKFCLARIFRIYPLFIAILLLTFFYLHLFIPISDSNLLSEWIKGVISGISADTSWINLVHNFNLIRNTASQRLIPQDWTLSIELLISIFSILFFITSIFSAELMLILSYYGIKQIGLNSFVFPFVLGSYLYIRAPFFITFIKRFYLLKYFILILSLVFFYNKIIFSESLMITLNKLFIDLSSLGATGLLFIVVASNRLQKNLQKKPFVFIGEISYSIYLVHFIVIIALIGLATTGLNILFISLLILSLTIVISYITNKFVEKPFMKLSKKILGILETKFALTFKK